MGFVDPKRDDDADDLLPGASGLHLDLDVKRCPACQREVLPWQTECPDCGETAVHPNDLPGGRFVLPKLPPDPDEGPGTDDAGDRADDGEADDGIPR